MYYFILLMLGIVGAFYLMSAYQYRGFSWIDDGCDLLEGLCQEPTKVAVWVIAVMVLVLIIRTVKSAKS
jgi:hypothetical protein